jgi:hypothetical protein
MLGTELCGLILKKEFIDKVKESISVAVAVSSEVLPLFVSQTRFPYIS